MAEFTLKKRTTGQMESDRINDVDDNWGTLETAIRDLQANASLFKPKPLPEGNYNTYEGYSAAGHGVYYANKNNHPNSSSFQSNYGFVIVLKYLNDAVIIWFSMMTRQVFVASFNSSIVGQPVVWSRLDNV